MAEIERPGAPKKYRDRRTERFALGERIKEFEALGGNRKGQYSIRINQQWRVCFEWPDEQKRPCNIEICDYHS